MKKILLISKTLSLSILFASSLLLSANSFASEKATIEKSASGKQAKEAEPAFENEIAAVTQSAPEDQIPLNVEKKEVTAEAESPLGKIALSMIILCAIGGGTYLFLKRFAKPVANSSMQIKVLTQHHLGPRKSLAIVRVAGESILIGVTEQNISMIKSLSLLDEDIPEVNENNFSESLKKAGQGQKEKVDDEFSMQGIREMVSQKLSKMRNLE